MFAKGNTIKYLVLLLVMFFVVGCGGFQLTIPQTQDEIYFEALGLWSDTVTNYNNMYATADAGTRAKFDNEFKPVLLQAKDILNAWDIIRGAGGPTKDNVQAWKDIKNELLLYLTNNL